MNYHLLIINIFLLSVNGLIENTLIMKIKYLSIKMYTLLVIFISLYNCTE